jgi:hypothetical protein
MNLSEFQLRDRGAYMKNDTVTIFQLFRNNEQLMQEKMFLISFTIYQKLYLTY